MTVSDGGYGGAYVSGGGAWVCTCVGYACGKKFLCPAGICGLMELCANVGFWW